MNLGCLVITKPSDDGKYLNVVRVLPLQKKAPKEGQDESDIPY